MPDSQSRESEKQILTVQKDIEHLQYVIEELEEQCEFVKNHFTTKNGERLDDIKVLHGRIEQHQQADLEFHENVRKKISEKFDTLDNRIRLLDRWKWATWGALMVTGALFGYFTPLSLK
jgi:tetrahydromethanopterin S-methyltransferase subunit G